MNMTLQERYDKLKS